VLKVVLVSAALLSVLEGCSHSVTYTTELENDYAQKVKCEATVVLGQGDPINAAMKQMAPCVEQYQKEGFHREPPGPIRGNWGAF
jgi:hypothetical protein